MYDKSSRGRQPGGGGGAEGEAEAEEQPAAASSAERLEAKLETLADAMARLETRLGTLGAMVEGSLAQQPGRPMGSAE